MRQRYVLKSMEWRKAFQKIKLAMFQVLTYGFLKMIKPSLNFFLRITTKQSWLIFLLSFYSFFSCNLSTPRFCQKQRDRPWWICTKLLMVMNGTKEITGYKEILAWMAGMGSRAVNINEGIQLLRECNSYVLLFGSQVLSIIETSSIIILMAFFRRF